jgi:hypothetical protein
MTPQPVFLVNCALRNIQIGAYAMAGKKSPSNERWNANEFVNIRLKDEEKVEFKSWCSAEGERINDMIGQACVDDYKFSLTWDDKNQCFIATMIGKEDQRHNAFKSLSSRSDDWFEAIALTVFKHVVLMRQGAWKGDTEKNNWG